MNTVFVVNMVTHWVKHRNTCCIILKSHYQHNDVFSRVIYDVSSNHIAPCKQATLSQSMYIACDTKHF